MSENERKTWIMIKKADRTKYIDFTEQIIPLFSSANQVTNEYGTWVVSGSGITSGSARNVFNGNTNSLARKEAGYDNSNRAYIYLTTPEGVELSISQFEIRAKDYGYVWKAYVEAYDNTANAWVPITEQVETPGSLTIVPMPTTSQAYYNKFRLAFYKVSNTGATYYSCDIYNWYFKVGTMKILPPVEA